MERNRVGEEKGGEGSMGWEAAVGRGEKCGRGRAGLRGRGEGRVWGRRGGGNGDRG